jgi:hypothetical protein
VTRAFEQQRTGEPAGSWADLDNCRLIERRGGARDPARQIEIEQEMLAEALARLEPMGGDDLPERRPEIIVHDSSPV